MEVLYYLLYYIIFYCNKVEVLLHVSMQSVFFYVMDYHL